MAGTAQWTFGMLQEIPCIWGKILKCGCGKVKLWSNLCGTRVLGNHLFHLFLSFGYVLCDTGMSLQWIVCVCVCVFVCVSCSVVSESCSPLDCSPPDSVHGVLQARILEWVAIPFSRGSFWPRDWTQLPSLQTDSWPSEPLGKPKQKFLISTIQWLCCL